MVDERQTHDGPPDGMPPAVYLYLSHAFSRLSAMIADSQRASRQQAEIGKEVLQRLERLEWFVFGAKEPPPLVSLPPPPPSAKEPTT